MRRSAGAIGSSDQREETYVACVKAWSCSTSRRCSLAETFFDCQRSQTRKSSVLGRGAQVEGRLGCLPSLQAASKR
jgi:hypothetical protein